MAEVSARMVTVWGDRECIAAAVDRETGEIIATATDSMRDDGTRIIVDEVAVWQATGELIPADMWDACKND